MVVAVEVQSHPTNASLISIYVEGPPPPPPPPPPTTSLSPRHHRHQRHLHRYVSDQQEAAMIVEEEWQQQQQRKNWSQTTSASPSSLRQYHPQDNSRLSVDTTISILNITEEDDDSDESDAGRGEYCWDDVDDQDAAAAQERSFLFEDMHGAPPLDSSLIVPGDEEDGGDEDDILAGIDYVSEVVPPTPPQHSRFKCCTDPLLAGIRNASGASSTPSTPTLAAAAAANGATNNTTPNLTPFGVAGKGAHAGGSSMPPLMPLPRSSSCSSGSGALSSQHADEEEEEAAVMLSLTRKGAAASGVGSPSRSSCRNGTSNNAIKTIVTPANSPIKKSFSFASTSSDSHSPRKGTWGSSTRQGYSPTKSPNSSKLTKSPSSSGASVATSTIVKDAASPFFDLPERFVQSLCFGNQGICSSANTSGTASVPGSNSSSSHGVDAAASGDGVGFAIAAQIHRDWDAYRRRLEEDIFDLLGCAGGGVGSGGGGSSCAGGSDTAAEHVWKQPLGFCGGNRSWSSGTFVGVVGGVVGMGFSRKQQKPNGSKNNRPRRRTLQDRAELLHKIRTERGLPQRRTGFAPATKATVSPTSAVLCPESITLQHRCRSMDDNYCRPRKLFNQDVDDDDYWKDEENDNKQNHQTSSGYDSDPGESFLEYGNSKNQQSSCQVGGSNNGHDLHTGPPLPCHLSSDISSSSDGLPYNMNQVVQDSLNITWTLTWHPDVTINPEATDLRKKQDNPQRACAGSRPPSPPPIPVQPSSSECYNMFIERGTLLYNNTTMLEPNLVWRPAHYHLPRRNSVKMPNAARLLACTSPCALRLLNVCRILVPTDPVIREDFSRRFPLARPSCSFIVRTNTHDHDRHIAEDITSNSTSSSHYCFECATKRDRDDIVRRLKLVVARFATLAILEDMDGILNEFFTTPTLTARGNKNPIFEPDDEEDYY